MTGDAFDAQPVNSLFSQDMESTCVHISVFPIIFVQHVTLAEGD